MKEHFTNAGLVCATATLVALGAMIHAHQPYIKALGFVIFLFCLASTAIVFHWRSFYK